MNIERSRRRLQEYLANGYWDAAEVLLESWCDRGGNRQEQCLHHIQLLQQLGRYRAAWQKAQTLQVDSGLPVELVPEVLACLRQFAAHDQLRDWANQPGLPQRLLPRDAADCAVPISAVGEHALAFEFANTAAERAPNDPVCRVHRALIAGYGGRDEVARIDLDWACAQTPPLAMAFWLRSRSRRASAAANDIVQLRNLLQQTNWHPQDRAYLAFALFKEYDDLGDAAAAFAALAEGCELMRVSAGYDAAAETALAQGMIEQFPLAQSTKAPADAAPHVPIFILGLHRSGTTLLERIIGAADGVKDLGETDRLRVAICVATDRRDGDTLRSGEPLRTEDIDWELLRSAFFSGAARQVADARMVTEKSPVHFWHVGFIRHALPEARVIHLRRDPIDLCFANLRERFGPEVRHAYSQAELIHYHGLYQRMMEHWHRTCPGFVLDVEYEALVQDPLAESKRVFEFLDLPWRPEVVDVQARAAVPVSTLSAAQVRQPLNSASIGRWRPYAEWLQPLCAAFPDSV
jgi:hypothetical protein